MIEINNCVKHIKLNFKLEIAFNEILKVANDLLMINDDRLIVVNLIDAAEIRLINNQYRAIDKITDVISFSFDESGIKGPIIGEIYICIEQAIFQAKEYSHSDKREICFLFTHGLLHLYGYDHLVEKDAKIMFDWQETILDKCQIFRRL